MELGLMGNIPCDADKSSDFRKKLKFFEDMTAFLEKNRRFPTDDELQNPFDRLSEGNLIALR